MASSQGQPCPHILDVLSRSLKHRENQRQQVKGHIQDLSKSLTFSNDVFSRTYPIRPREETYVSAKERAGDLFYSQSMPVEIREPKLSALSGRHNPRGSGWKHIPCYFDKAVKDGALPGTLVPLVQSGMKPRPQRKGTKASVVQETRAVYVDALLGGAKPMHPSNSMVKLDNGRRYKKTLQQLFPQSPDKYTIMKNKDWERVEKERLLCLRGQRPERWLEYPRITKSTSHDWVLRSPSATPSRAALVQDKGTDAAKKDTENNFFDIMQEWASQRQLYLQPKDIPPYQVLLKDLQSLSNRSKMAATLAVVLLAQQRRERQNDQYGTQEGGVISEELVRSLGRLLEESEALHVRVPSAVALHAIHRASSKAQTVLMEALAEEREGLAEESWASVQCLAHAGRTCAPIITKLLEFLFNDHTPNKQETAAALLVKVSQYTDLVFHMLADRLNASSWRERVITCDLLPRLCGRISNDLCGKLLVCVWEDWSEEVQHAATRALGRTDHGKMIHDEIANRLTNGSEMIRLDAIRKLYSLGIMTSQLLPGYLSCFSDEHVSIQSESLAMAGALRLQHPLVVAAIKQLLQESRVWSIKIDALRALACIGQWDQELVQQLVWMVRFEKLPAVRVETCRTIGQLGLRDKEVMESLKTLVTAEEDEAVISEARQTLATMGAEEHFNDEMLEKVCQTVRELGSKEAITSTILDINSQTMADYVLDKRSHKPISARDYLNQHSRSRTLTDNVTPYKDPLPTHPEEHLGLSPGWGPDRKFINSKLATIRTRLKHMRTATT